MSTNTIGYVSISQELPIRYPPTRTLLSLDSTLSSTHVRVSSFFLHLDAPLFIIPCFVFFSM